MPSRVWHAPCYLSDQEIELTSPASPALQVILYLLIHRGYIFRENHNPKGHINLNVHCATIYNSQDMEAT